jgi:hypothetical protein
MNKQKSRSVCFSSTGCFKRAIRFAGIVGIIALSLLTMPLNIQTVKADGQVGYFTEYFGDCWYIEPYSGQWMGAAQYYYDSFTHVTSGGVVRNFYPLTIWYSGVCPDDNAYGVAYSTNGDGWRMEVNGPYNIKVFNAANQQVYP